MNRASHSGMVLTGETEPIAMSVVNDKSQMD
jgi:uncharacterized transporter YbjL